MNEITIDRIPDDDGAILIYLDEPIVGRRAVLAVAPYAMDNYSERAARLRKKIGDWMALHGYIRQTAHDNWALLRHVPEAYQQKRGEDGGTDVRPST